MSADNWAICPQCNSEQGSKKLKAEHAADVAYDTKPAREWERLKKIAESIPMPAQTLREDYEVGILPGGEFTIQYTAACAECGFSYKHSVDQKVFPEPTKPTT